MSKEHGSDAQAAETEKKFLGEKEPKKVIILGTAETMSAAPFEDETWEVWGTGTVMGHNPGRIDRLFELHTKDRWKNRIQQLNAANVPVMMQEKNEEIPKSEVFPRDRLLNKYRPYVTNSISWMIMYAIDQGYDEIALFGVHMAVDTEYSYERPSVEYWIGYAEAQGVNIWIAEGAEILTAARLYGYENRHPLYDTMKMRKKALSERIQSQQDKVNKAMAELHQLKGAMSDLDYWLKQFK